MVRVAVPLGEGMIPWPEVIVCLEQASFDGWVSVHREYGDPAVEAVVADVSKDLEYLRGVMQA